MATKRKGISASLRWAVFARDGFVCRYCGRSAGDETILHADHVVSVNDGGENEMDNLVTACQRCNGGKGAKSLSSAPTPKQVVARITKQAATIRQQADAIHEAAEARKERIQAVVNLLCTAYRVDSFKVARAPDYSTYATLCDKHGADQVLTWVEMAASRGVRQADCLRYVHGIIKNIREGNHRE